MNQLSDGPGMQAQGAQIRKSHSQQCRDLWPRPTCGEGPTAALWLPVQAQGPFGEKRLRPDDSLADRPLGPWCVTLNTFPAAPLGSGKARPSETEIHTRPGCLWRNQLEMC